MSEYSEWWEWSRCLCVCMRVYACVLDFLIFEPLKSINGLRTRVEIWYSSEAVTPLQSWQFLCKLTPNVIFYGISNFLKYVCGSSNFRKIWPIVPKLHTNIINRSKTFGIEFGRIRLERSNLLILNLLKIFSKLCNLCKLRVIQLKICV